MGKKRGRFGRITGATLRRLPTEDRYRGQDVCLIQKKVEYHNHQDRGRNILIVNEKKQEMLVEFERQFDDGGLEGFLSNHVLNPNSEYTLSYSLNKRKRWELPNILKDNITFDGAHETNKFEVVLVERSIGNLSTHSADCIGIHKSKGDIHSKKPRKKYARAEDLIDVEHNARASNIQRNSGHRKKRRIEHEDNEPSSPTPCVKYEVSYARPREEYPYFKSTRQRQDFSDKRKLTTKDYRNMYHSEFEDDEAYYSDHFDTDDGYLGDEESMVYFYDPVFSMRPPPSTLGDFLEFSDKPARSPKSKKHRSRKSVTCDKPKYSGKDRKVMLNPPDSPTTNVKHSAAVVASSPDSLPAIPPTASIHITKSSVTPECLEIIFKSDYIEGASLPRRFLIDVTSHVRDTLHERGISKAVKQLEKTGQRIVVIFTNIEKEIQSFVNYSWTENDSVSLEEVGEYSVCLFGLDDQLIAKYEDKFTNALCNNKTFSVTDVITIVKTILDQLPANHFYTSVKTSQGPKPHLAFKSLQDHLHQVSEVMTPHALHQMNASSKGITPMILNAQLVQQNTCGICYEDLLPSIGGSSATALCSCQHRFCNNCWRHHIHTRVGRGDCSILCPEYPCDNKVDTPTLMSLMSTNQFQNHTTHRQNRIVDNDPSWHWCPEPSCGRVGRVRQSKDGQGIVPCDCGKSWCVGCKADVHWPALCQQAGEYTKSIKKREENKRGNRITMVQVKKCPHCNRLMEKNGGCPNMICFCGNSFCWVCLQPHHYTPACHSVAKQHEIIELYPVVLGVTKDEILGKALDFRKMTSRSVFTKIKRDAIGLLTKMHAKTVKQNSDNKKIAIKCNSLSNEKRMCSWCINEAEMKIHTEAVALAEEIAEFYTETYHLLEWTCVFMAHSVVSSSKIMRRMSHLLPQLVFILETLDEIVSKRRNSYETAKTKKTFRQLLTNGKHWRQVLYDSGIKLRTEVTEQLQIDSN